METILLSIISGLLFALVIEVALQKQKEISGTISILPTIIFSAVFTVIAAVIIFGVAYFLHSIPFVQNISL